MWSRRKLLVLSSQSGLELRTQPDALLPDSSSYSSEILFTAELKIASPKQSVWQPRSNQRREEEEEEVRVVGLVVVYS